MPIQRHLSSGIKASKLTLMLPQSPSLAPSKQDIDAYTEPEYVAERPSLGVRIATLLAIVVPFLGLSAAVFLSWGWGFSWLHLGLLLGMYMATAVGITVGFHRLFTHRSFETTRRIKLGLAILGSMALEGPMLKWVAMHRRHHQHSDGVEDPHSPRHHGEGWRGLIAGAFHAHLGWMFDRDPENLQRYVTDLAHDRLLRFVSNTWHVWSAIGLLIPALLGGLITMTWAGALLGFIWGGLARVFFVHHVTWSVNSVCHLWGARPFATRDESRNNALFGVLALGEGWHNNHHAFPTSARHGLQWWQFDLSYWIIRGLKAVGLAWNVKVPSPERIREKMGVRQQPA